MHGRYVDVEPLDLDRHVPSLFRAQADDRDGRRWTYLAFEQPATEAAYRAFLAGIASGNDPLFHAIVDLPSGRAVGVASYLRIDPDAGSIEVGGLSFSPLLQRTPAATEAMFLMMQRAFGKSAFASSMVKSFIKQMSDVRC